MKKTYYAPSIVIIRFLSIDNRRGLMISNDTTTAWPADEEDITSRMSADERYYICWVET